MKCQAQLVQLCYISLSALTQDFRSSNETAVHPWDETTLEGRRTPRPECGYDGMVNEEFIIGNLVYDDVVNTYIHVHTYNNSIIHLYIL